MSDLIDREENIDPSLMLRMTVQDLSCHSEEPWRRRICVFSIIVWVLITFPVLASELTHPKTFKGSDPKGWGQFYWQMTKQQAEQLGAAPFVDGAGEKCFGLSEVELLGDKKFQVCLKFFSHMGLNAVRVSLAPHTECAKDVYETLLNDFRETHGKEMESRDLTYPNAYYKSHDWIIGSTKLVLHHGCPKPGTTTATQPTTHIWYEKRLEYEPWNR